MVFRKFLDEQAEINEFEKLLWKQLNVDLKTLCKRAGLKNYSNLGKSRLIKLLLDHKKTEKDRVRRDYERAFDFDEFCGIKDKLPK